MEFNHLADTRFPNFDTVHPYQFKNEFDYSRWIPGTRIKACNVPWDSAYENVVKFDTDSDRDSYFNSIEDSHIEMLNVDARVLPENYVKLPIPFDVMAGYNYLVIDIPIATGSEHIDYESRTGFRRWHFFISDMQYLAPNTTQVFVQLDVWTQFINNVEIPYMMLERGHAPVWATDVYEYLADPLGNNRYLLAPDVNFGDSDVIRSAKQKVFGNGEKLICFVTHYNKHVFDFADQFFGSVTPDNYYAYRTIRFEDGTDPRWGADTVPADYGFTDGKDYSSLITPSSYDNHTLKSIPNNVSVIAIAASDCYKGGTEQQTTFFEWASQNKPTFFKGVEAIFMVDNDMVELESSFTFGGYTMYWVSQSKDRMLDGIRLSKEDFGFPDEISNFAKLYTYPYSSIEVSDNRGEKSIVQIENISGANKIHWFMSCAYPFINMRFYMSGINGRDNTEMPVWYELDDSVEYSKLPGSDWLSVCFDFQIPTYSYYMTPLTNYMVESFQRGVKDSMRQAANAYTTNARDANNAKANSDDYANTAHSNAYLGADFAYTIATNTINAARANITNSIAAQTTQHMNVRQNKEDMLDTKQTYENLIVAYAQTAAETITMTKNSLAQQNLNGPNGDNTLLTYGTQLQNETAIATTTATNAANVGSSTFAGAVNGAQYGGGAMAAAPTVATSVGTAALTMAGMGAAAGSIVPGVGTAAGAVVGVAIGAVIGAAGGALSSNIQASTVAEASNSNAIITANTNATVAAATSNRNSRNMSRTNEANVLVTATNSDKLGYDNAKNHDMQVDLLKLENKLDVDNYKAEYNAAVANRDNLYKEDLSDPRNNGSEIANRDNNRTLAKAVADAIKTVTNSNSHYTRELAIDNLQDIMRTSINTAASRYLDALKDSPRQYTESTGDISTQVYRQQGISIKVKTQSDDAIAMTGSMFARYGYALNQIWNVSESGLNLMEHFTYWKAGDLWLVNSEGGNASQNETLRNIFRNGVTVWRNPDDLGGVSIYDN